MDSIRVAKVAGVHCTRPGSSSTGSLHLTAHHLIYQPDGPPPREMWVPYPLIALVTRLPQTLRGRTPVAFRCRTFEAFTLAFADEQAASDVFESVRELTVATSVAQLYAFCYQPSPPLPTSTGWALYAPREEFARMGVGSRTKAWRFSDINRDFSFCPTYPARLVVPTKISDTTLRYASKYRSKSRIPTLAYLHWANYGSITRSSQPMVGLTNNRSMQDEKLIEAIFQSHHSPDTPYTDLKVYGATATNLIIDARPTTNAMANVARGAGTENMDNYKEGKKAYLGVDNIHVMRDSLAKVVDALHEADLTAATIQNLDPSQSAEGNFLDRQALRRSGWLRHMSALLDGAVLIVRNVHVNSSHVLIHCSDGWDRTAQLSSLAQLCLDPYYRTMRGFEILLEKDWLSFGHRFGDRCGHLSSEKFFLAGGVNDTTGGAEAAQAAQAFLASVQNRFASQQHLKETSPVFHQFLECVRQIQRQFPARFEFNARFLERLHYHLYACQFGTFLFNNERERRVGEGGPPPCERTVSAWDWFNTPEEVEQNKNEGYDPSLDNPKSRAAGADMGVLFPNPKDVRFWHELYGRTDEEMNGRFAAGHKNGAESTGPVDAAEDDVPDTPPARSPSTPPSSASAAEPALPANSVGTSLAASVSAPSLPVAPERPAPARTDSFSPFGTLAAAYPLSPAHRGPAPEAGPSSAPRRAAPRLPDALTGAGIRSMWGRLSSNASAALSVVQDAYEGVAREYAAGAPSGAAAAAGGELQATDSAGLAWSSRAAAAAAAADTGSNPWATPPPPPRASRSLSSSWNPGAADDAAQPLSAPPAIAMPSDPSVAHPPPLHYAASAASRAPRAAPLSMAESPPSEVALPPSRSPSLSGVAVTPQERAPPGQQSDPLGVGWL